MTQVDPVVNPNTPPAPPTPAPPAPNPNTPPTPAPAPVITDPTELRNALQSERALREQAERANKAITDENARLKQGQMTEQEKLIETAKADAVKSTMGAVNKRLFSAEVRALVSGKVVDMALFTDSAITLSLLGMSDVPLDKAGEIDTEAIKKAVDALLAAKPYLTASTTQPPKFPPVDQGVQGNGTPPNFAQMTDDEYVKWANENDPNTRRRTHK